MEKDPRNKRPDNIIQFNSNEIIRRRALKAMKIFGRFIDEKPVSPEEQQRAKQAVIDYFDSLSS